MYRPTARSLYLLSALSLVAFGGCTTTQKKDKRSGISSALAGDRKVFLNFNQAAAGSLALDDQVTATDVKVKLTCDGFADNDPQNQPIDYQPGTPITVYGEPTNCLLKLLSFKIADSTYQPKDGSGFANYLAGDTATFTDGTEDLALRVDTQLPSPLAADSTVQYSFAQILQDQTVNLENLDIKITENTVNVTGDEAPELSLVKAQIVQLNYLDAGLRLILNCAEPIAPATGTDLTQVTCHGVKLSDIEVHAGSLPTGTITADVLTKLFKDSMFALSCLSTAKVVAPSYDAANGGVELTLKLSDIGFLRLQDLANKQLLFALRKHDGLSFRYSLINIPDLPELKHRACKYGHDVVIPHGTIYQDKSKPLYSAPVAKMCSVVGYATYTCTDGQLFDAAGYDNTYTSCQACSDIAQQSRPAVCQ